MSGHEIDEQLDDLRQRVERLEAASSTTDLQQLPSCSCDELVTQGAAKIRVNAAGEDVQEITEFSGAVPGVTRGRATIDWSRNDNGFLGCVDGVYRRASNLTVRSHPSTAIAFGNLRGGREGFSIIVGHGAPGVIVCGTGQIVNGVDKYIAASNETVWRPIASQGIAGTQLTLFGCEVAAGTNRLRK